MLAQPCTKFDSLVDRLNELANHPEHITDIVIMSLKKEAEKVKTIDPSHGFSLLAMIACLEGKQADMRNNHEKALALSPHDPIIWKNYAVSLAKCLCFEEAYEKAKQAYQLNHLEVSVLDTIIWIANKLELEDELKHYLSEWEKLTGKPHPYINFIEDNTDILQTMLDDIEKDIKENPSHIISTDSEEFQQYFILAESLVEGINV